jgi:L-lactate dehydrogenase complex protein LldF
MLPVLLMEPVSYSKRQHYSETLKEPKRRLQPNLPDVKQRLREIRDYSLAHLDELVSQLTASLAGYPEVEITFAQDAGQAVETIRGIAGGGKIAVNKSAVIGSELMPTLVASGYNVIESYYDEFEPFDNSFSEYWQLPVMTFESRFQSFKRPVDLTALRAGSIRENGTKDFIGLLGVNAISAQGTVLMLQHMHNISKVFKQARELILVVGLDKIVKSLDDAIFQTKCMAIFGSEALPLTLGGRAKQESSLDELPFEIPLEQTPSKIRLVLLDNGRSQILRSPYKELLACIDCQACIKDCPTSPFFADGARWSPREYIYFFIVGKNPSLDLCLQCKTCETNCPLDIDLPGMILNAKAEFTSKRRRSLTDTLLAEAETLQSWGSSAAWLANALSSNRPLRWMAEKVLDISRERQLPRVHRHAFAKWFTSRVTKG